MLMTTLVWEGSVRGAGSRKREARCEPYHRGVAIAAGPVVARRGTARMQDDAANVTQLLRAVASGDRREMDALMSAIYTDLRRLAMSHMQGERRSHTLQPTALVHEAYLRLINQRSTQWQDRVHFFAVASRVIRRILVDHARERGAQKRGGGARRVEMEQADLADSVAGIDLLALDDALAALADIDARQAQIVELRFFGGLTVDEVAELLGIAPRSVDRDWRCARAWLLCRLEGGEETDAGPEREP